MQEEQHEQHQQASAPQMVDLDRDDQSASSVLLTAQSVANLPLSSPSLMPLCFLKSALLVARNTFHLLLI
jgi:hypothetical protein